MTRSVLFEPFYPVNWHFSRRFGIFRQFYPADLEMYGGYWMAMFCTIMDLHNDCNVAAGSLEQQKKIPVAYYCPRRCYCVASLEHPL